MPNYESAIQSLVNFQNSQGVTARGTILRLSRATVIFEVYNPYSIVQLSEVLESFTIRRGDRAIYKGRAIVANLVNTGLMLIVSVNLVDTWSDLAGLLGSGKRVGEEVRRFLGDFDSISGVKAGYQLIVSSLRTFLAELGRWLEQVDLEGNLTVDVPPKLPEDVYCELAEPLFPRLTQLFGTFEEEARSIPEEDVSFHKAYAQRDLHPLLLRAPFVHRTFSKPLGYAGDYEMVNMMIRNEREGPNTYAQLLHDYCMRTGVCQAHRNRIRILTERLIDVVSKVDSGGQARILNVGCGPAHEVLDFIRREALSSHCHFELVDFNFQTLQETRKAADTAMGESGNTPEIDYLHESIHNLLKYAVKPEFSDRVRQYDFIYCAGLFDYLSDRVCSRLCSLFLKWVKIGGVVLVTNVHSRNEYRGLMEHILDWYLVYRDERQMESISAPQAQKRIYTDDTGLNVFLEMTAPERQ